LLQNIEHTTKINIFNQTEKSSSFNFKNHLIFAGGYELITFNSTPIHRHLMTNLEGDRYKDIGVSNNVKIEVTIRIRKCIIDHKYQTTRDFF
jgi:hypothetical protein